MSRLKPPIGSEDHMTGPRIAPVSLVEYGDFECGFCGEAFPIVQALLEHLDDQVRFAFRHFPLVQAHPHAALAAQAAEAAAAQGQFWEMHDRLFEHQDALSMMDLVGHATALDLDVDRFLRDLSEDRYSERVARDFHSGVRSGVNGTPTFFIDEVLYDGSWDVASLLGALTSTARSKAGEPSAQR